MIRAVISSGDSKETAEKQVLESSGGLVGFSRNGGVNVRAVIRIRKKMKERLSEKIEDQWESFINGIGRGILLLLISQDVDPGTKLLILVFGLTSFLHVNMFCCFLLMDLYLS